MVWRNLKPNHSGAIPRRIVFLDTETIKEPKHDSPNFYNHYLRCGVAISVRLEGGKVTRRNVCKFSSNYVFWQWFRECLAPRETTWLVAHRAAFDWQIIGGWEEFGKGKIVLDAPRSKRPVMDGNADNIKLQRGICVLDDPPFIVGLRTANDERFVVVDTLNYFRQPLKKIGHDIGLEKLQMPDSNAPYADWLEYCQRDCEIVERAFVSLANFTKENNHGMFRYTAPAQAMACYRHKHMNHKVVLHDELDVKRVERSAYYGGALRVFYRGKAMNRVWQVDVNSLYPYVMQQGKFPSKLRQSDLSGQDSVLPPSHDLSEHIAEVTIDTKSGEYPLRGKHGTMYCNGRFRTTLCGPELVRAYRSNDIICFHKWASYRCEPLFVDYVNDLYSLRQRYKAAGNETYAGLCKLMLNSLYGKFGQRSFKWVHRPDLIAPKEWFRWLEKNTVTGNVELFRSIGEQVFHSPEPAESPESFPAIPAFVCAMGREYMRSLIGIAGKEFVYYQATDSLVVSEQGYWNLLQSGLMNNDELGKLRLIRTGDEAEFRGANNYTIGSEDVRAGIRASAVRTTENNWQQECFERAENMVAREPSAIVESWSTIFSERSYSEAKQVYGCGWLEPLFISGPASKSQGSTDSN